jgi:hypothetical protein
LEESSGFTIENNFIRGNARTGIGIHFKDNSANNFVRSNTFDNLCTACEVVGQNGTWVNGEPQGLLFLCNNYKDNGYDIHVGIIGWMHFFQSGLNDIATGNTFSNSYSNIIHYDLYYLCNVRLYYNFFEPILSQHITHYNVRPAINLEPRDRVSCISYGYAGENYYNVAIVPPLSDLESSYLLAAELHTDGIVRTGGNDLGSIINWENPEVEIILKNLRNYNFDEYIRVAENGTIQIVNRNINFLESEPLLVQQVFLSVYLSNLRKIMDNLCYKALEIISNETTSDGVSDRINIEQYRTWISRLNTIESKYLLVETYLETGEFTMAEAKLDAMLPHFANGGVFFGENNIAYQHYRQYVQLVKDYYQFTMENNEAEIPDYILNGLQNLSQNNDIAGRKSASFLETFMEMEQRPDRTDLVTTCNPSISYGLQKSTLGNPPVLEEKTNNTKTEAIQISLFPNPAKNTVNIALNKKPESSVLYQLYDIQGRELQSGTFSRQQEEINISSLSKGMYFITITSENQKKKKKKLVKE